jgi:hypothetical protein
MAASQNTFTRFALPLQRRRAIRKVERGDRRAGKRGVLGILDRALHRAALFLRGHQRGEQRCGQQCRGENQAHGPDLSAPARCAWL